MTSVVVLTPPTTPAVSYDEAKAHLRFYGDDEPDEGEAYIMALVAAAQQHFAGPFGWLGRSIGMQTLELRTCGFNWCGIQLPYGPVRTVESITYLDADGDEQTVDPVVYTLSGEGSVTAYLKLASGRSWPALPSAGDTVRIAYTAGYEPDDVPAPLKHAILLLVSHWYENREASVVSATQIADLPFAVQALASPFRLGFI